MPLYIMRYQYGVAATNGLLMLDSIFTAFTLELPKTFEGQENVIDKTCIPVGAYRGQVLTSPKHPDGAPHILGVPGRSAVEIHIANAPKDIKGCAAVGMAAAPYMPWVGDSAVAFAKLMQRLPKADAFTVGVMNIVPGQMCSSLPPDAISAILKASGVA